MSVQDICRMFLQNHISIPSNLFVIFLSTVQVSFTPNKCLSVQVQLSASFIMMAEDAAKQEEAAAMAGTWEGEKLRVSKYVLILFISHNCK